MSKKASFLIGLKMAHTRNICYVDILVFIYLFVYFLFIYNTNLNIFHINLTNNRITCRIALWYCLFLKDQP